MAKRAGIYGYATEGSGDRHALLRIRVMLGRIRQMASETVELVQYSTAAAPYRERIEGIRLEATRLRERLLELEDGANHFYENPEAMAARRRAAAGGGDGL